MGKSKKLAIYKDVGFAKKTYHRIVRSNINQRVRAVLKERKVWMQEGDFEEEPEIILPNPKEIVNDYDYSDYTFDLEHDNNPYWDNERKEMRRK